MGFTITGTGKCVPKHVVTNDMIAEFLDTNDEWISDRTGIKSRHVLTDETILDLSAKAAEEAIKDAGLVAEDIDAIIFSTLQGDFISPATSCLIAKRIGCPTSRVIDVNMGCCGFVFALDIADSFIKSGKADKVLVVCGEGLSKIVDWTDRSTCILFGDGAGAVVVQKDDSENDFVMNIDGNEGPLLIPGSHGNSPYMNEYPHGHFLKMDGQEIFKFAVSSIEADIKEILNRNSLTSDDVNYFVLHQANLRIIRFARTRLRGSEEKFPHNVETHGNTSSASIPMMLDDLNKSGKLEKGMNIVLSAFGAGLSRGACLLKWGK